MKKVFKSPTSFMSAFCKPKAVAFKMALSVELFRGGSKFLRVTSQNTHNLISSIRNLTQES